MHEQLNSIVDEKGLKHSKELGRPVEDDAKRANINSVKLRAAAQNVDYPAFAALVSCAHLKPMTRKELDSREKKLPNLNPNVRAWSFGSRCRNLSARSPTTMLTSPTESSEIANKPSGLTARESIIFAPKVHTRKFY
ncbi:unnamed protein product [Calypogeia fissa]